MTEQQTLHFLHMLGAYICTIVLSSYIYVLSLCNDIPGKGLFSFQSKERQCQRMLKLLHNALISHASKVMFKILQARIQQYMNCELPDVQAGFRKGRRTTDQIANIH